jgi:hypothetical protein
VSVSCPTLSNPRRRPGGFSHFRREPDDSVARFEILQAVELTEDIPSHRMRSGAVATIVFVFDQPEEAYELEIVGNNGETLAQFPVTPNQIRPLGVRGK